MGIGRARAASNFANFFFGMRVRSDDAVRLFGSGGIPGDDFLRARFAMLHDFARQCR